MIIKCRQSTKTRNTKYPRFRCFWCELPDYGCFLKTLLYLQGNAQNIQQQEDADSGDPTYGGDEHCCKVVSEIRFSHPLNDMQRIEKKQQDNTHDGIDHKHHEFFAR